MSGEKTPLSERFATVASLVGQYGYEVRTQAGRDNGQDWEILFSRMHMLDGRQPITYCCAAPTEDALLEFLARWLPEKAANEWRGIALALEGELARRDRGK
jgi:hypothetical protein